MTVEFSEDPDDPTFGLTVDSWESAATFMVITLLVAASEDGFDEQELFSVLVGATPTEVTRLGFASIRKLVDFEA